jgi:hypothetical protein
VEKNFTLILPALALENMLTLGAGEANGASMMQLVLAADIAPGTYDMTDSFDGISASYLVTTPTQQSFSSTTGSMTIITNDATGIKGTFHYSALEFDDTTTTEVTDGEFYIEY